MQLLANYLEDARRERFSPDIEYIARFWDCSQETAKEICRRTMRVVDYESVVIII